MNRLRKKQFCAYCAELHSLKKNRPELPPSERSFHIGSKTRTEKMSNVSPRSAYSFIPGKSLGMGYFSHTHRSPQDRSTRRKKGILCKEKAHSTVCRTGFFGIVTQFPMVWSKRQTLSRGERIRKISIPITRRSIGDC